MLRTGWYWKPTLTIDSNVNKHFGTSELDNVKLTSDIYFWSNITANNNTSETNTAEK